jgi:hypothetical protein
MKTLGLSKTCLPLSCKMTDEALLIFRMEGNPLLGFYYMFTRPAQFGEATIELPVLLALYTFYNEEVVKTKKKSKKQSSSDTTEICETDGRVAIPEFGDELRTFKDTLLFIHLYTKKVSSRTSVIPFNGLLLGTQETIRKQLDDEGEYVVADADTDIRGVTVKYNIEDIKNKNVNFMSKYSKCKQEFVFNLQRGLLFYKIKMF